MDPTLIYGAVTGVEQTRQQFTATPQPFPNATPAATRSWRRGIARVLHGLAERLEPAPTPSTASPRSVPAT